MHRFTSLATTLLGCALIALPALVQAQSYRCTGADGKRYYGQTIPRPCIGQMVEQLNEQGLVVRRIEPRSSAEERAAKAEEEKQQREEELARREERRRNRALLATYTSVDDIEDARIRALKGNAQAIKEVDERIAQIKARQQQLAQEIAAYKEKPPPADLQRDMRNTDIDLVAQQGLREAKQKEAEAINAKYDEDRQRYVDLTQPKRNDTKQ